jgi:hypothetical protein
MTRLTYRGRRYEVKRHRVGSNASGRWIAWCQTLQAARLTAQAQPVIDGWEVAIWKLVDTRSGRALGVPVRIATFPKGAPR